MENFTNENGLPLVLMAGENENVQEIEIIGDNATVGSLSGHQINLIDLNIFTHPVENQLADVQQGSSSHEILRQSEGDNRLVTYTIFKANDIGSEKEETSLQSSKQEEELSSQQVYVAEKINEEVNNDQSVNNEKGNCQIFVAEKINEQENENETPFENSRNVHSGTCLTPHNTETTNVCLDEETSSAGIFGNTYVNSDKGNVSSRLVGSNNYNGIKKSSSGPVFHGLKARPSKKGAVFKNKKKRNIFESLESCGEENQNKVQIDKIEKCEISDTYGENYEINRLEESLKISCLNNKAIVKLVPLDKRTLSIYSKKKNTSKSKKIEISNKKTILNKREFKYVYGKKKKKKVSVQLLREIDKAPGKKFTGKVPEAKKLWKKIEKMEKTGINWKKKQGRRAIEGEFPCHQCDYVAKQKSHLQAHQSIHVKKWITCNFCKFQSRSESKMMEHEARHTGAKPFKCKFEGCDYAGVCKGDLTKHQRKHQEDKPYKCPHCDFGTKWPRNIRHHLLTHTDDRPYVCKQCGFAFKRQTDLNYHMYRHSDLKPIKCEKCEFRCKTNFEIKCHMLKHSDVRYFKCTYPGCKQETKTKSDLTKHMKIHSKTLDFVCDLCGKGFKTKGSMKKHLLRHSEERPWKCDLCDRRFKIKPALRNHINMHAGYKPHSCEVCGMLFSSLSNKRTHMRVHSAKDRPLKCPICPYLGKTQDHILSHIGTMHGSQYAYFCEICKKPFKRYHLLQVHYPRCHTKEEMAFMESTLKLNIQAIKSEAIDEISKSELSKRNADLNWDCIIVKDERCDPSEDQNEKQDDLETDLNSDMMEKVETDVAEMHRDIDNSEQTSQIEEKESKMEIKVAKSESLENSTESQKAATLAIYDGFRLPLATVGFHFNFIKKGKKTKAWFMDQNLMDESARNRHIMYLKRKQEEMLYGYYNSKRRRIGSKKRIGKGKLSLKKRTKVKSDLKNKTMPKIVITPSSSQTKKIEAEKWLNISIKKSLSELKGTSAHSETSLKLKNVRLQTSASKMKGDSSSIKPVDKKTIKHADISKQQVKPKIKPGRKRNVSNSFVNSDLQKDKGKPGKKQKKGASPVVSNNGRKIKMKAKGKPVRKPAVTEGQLTKLKRKSGSAGKSVSEKTLQPKTQKRLTKAVKGKPGRKPVVQSDLKAKSLKKEKPERNPTNFENMTIGKRLSTKPKGKRGRPTRKKDNFTIKLPKPKGKPGRKPKNAKLDETTNTPVIKQEIIDEFDSMTTAINSLIENQSIATEIVNYQTNVDNMSNSDINNSVEKRFSSNSSLFDRIKTNKRKSLQAIIKHPAASKKQKQDKNVTHSHQTESVSLKDNNASYVTAHSNTSKPVKVTKVLGGEKSDVKEKQSKELGTASSSGVAKKRKFFIQKGMSKNSNNVTPTSTYTALLNTITSATLTGTTSHWTTGMPETQISGSNQSVGNKSTKRLIPVQNLPSHMLQKININNDDENTRDDDGKSKKRGKNKQYQAEVVIENAEEMDTQESVYPVSIQAAVPVDYNSVIVKEEYNVQLREIDEENNFQNNHSTENEPAREITVTNRNKEGSIADHSIISFGDDVTAMRNSFQVQVNSSSAVGTISEKQINTFAETGEQRISTPSTVSHLRLEIQTDSTDGTNSQTRSNDNIEMENDLSVHTARTNDSGMVLKISEGMNDEQSHNGSLIDVSEKSSPVKEEPMDKNYLRDLYDC